jgi:hypothetical protein
MFTDAAPEKEPVIGPKLFSHRADSVDENATPKMPVNFGRSFGRNIGRRAQENRTRISYRARFCLKRFPSVLVCHRCALV